MQTVLLAGGTGKRVFPLAVNTPKPMFKILGKPLIEHVIETLKEAGLKDFIIVIGHNGEQIRKWLANGSRLGVNINYAFQKKALGMANALKASENQLEDHFFVVNADDIFQSSLIEEMKKQFKQGDSDIILSCKTVNETWKFGIIEIEGARVTRIVEKPPKGKEPSKLGVVGVYILPKRILDYYKKIPVSDHQFEDALQKSIQEKSVVRTVKYEGFFAGLKYPWDLFAINKYLMDVTIREQTIEEDVDISERAIVEGNVWLRRGTKILDFAFLKGPCYIGSNSFVGNNCLIREYSSIGNNCVVGFSSEIKHSLVGDNCQFHLNYVGDSIIGDNCLFGAGAITANFRFDEKDITLQIEGKETDSGTNKLGAIISDYCRIGVNACLSPGVRIGPNSIVGPNVYAKKDLKPRKMILLDRKSYSISENKITPFPDEEKTVTQKMSNCEGEYRRRVRTNCAEAKQNSEMIKSQRDDR